MILLGPIPEEWVASLGMYTRPRKVPALMESTEPSYAAGARDTSFEQNVLSNSEVDDAPGLVALLQWVLVLDPLRRPSMSDLLDHPWFVDPPNPAPPSGSA